MSTREEDTRNYVGEKASKAASIIDSGARRSADAVSSAAHQAADQVGKASDYVWKKSERLRERAAGASDIATEHPIYTLIAVGLIGFGLGFVVRGGRRGSY